MVPAWGTLDFVPWIASMPFCRPRASRSQPVVTATYCSPSISNEVGTPIAPEGSGKLHSCQGRVTTRFVIIDWNSPNLLARSGVKGNERTIGRRHIDVVTIQSDSTVC